MSRKERKHTFQFCRFIQSSNIRPNYQLDNCLDNFIFLLLCLSVNVYIKINLGILKFVLEVVEIKFRFIKLYCRSFCMTEPELHHRNTFIIIIHTIYSHCSVNGKSTAMFSRNQGTIKVNSLADFVGRWRSAAFSRGLGVYYYLI